MFPASRNTVFTLYCSFYRTTFIVLACDKSVGTFPPVKSIKLDCWLQTIAILNNLSNMSVLVIKYNYFYFIFMEGNFRKEGAGYNSPLHLLLTCCRKIQAPPFPCFAKSAKTKTNMKLHCSHISVSHCSNKQLS